MAATTLVIPREKGFLDRLLNLAADVRPGESGTVLMLAVNAFLLLAAYYILKPVREALILSGGGAEIKSYSGAVQAGLFLFIIPAYGAFASRVNRVRLINGVSLFFISTLLIFYALSKTPVPLGVPFFLWVGIFNVMVIAQFWSFANDLYTEEEGKRLFAVAGIGTATGSIAGTQVAEVLPVDSCMLVAAGMLAVCLAMTNLIDRREKSRPRQTPKPKATEPLGKEGGFQLVMRQRYLLYIGLLMMVIQLVNTNGEYIMGRTFADAAKATAAASGGAVTQKQLIGTYYAKFYFWQNILTASFQFFLVSRIIKYLGVRGALFIPPALSLGGYGLIAAVPVLASVRMAKLVENSTDYSLENTVRHSLFLPTSREAKYKAKQVIDSFFWRAGDMLSALAVFAGIRLLGVGTVAAINAGLVALWLLLAVGIAREHRKISEQQPVAEAA
jgi:AAA family ATP:ADP antiporter